MTLSMHFILELIVMESPVIISQPVTQLEPLAIYHQNKPRSALLSLITQHTFGGANTATQEYCPPATGREEHISAIEYATVRVSTQIAIHE